MKLRTFVFVTFLSCWFLLYSSASAQITAAQLIGRSVADPDDARYQDINQAITQFFQGDTEAARQALEAARRSSPELSPAGVMLAQLFFATNQIPNTRVELEKVVTSSANDPEAYLLFGDLALRESRLTEADTLYSRGYDLTENLKNNDFRRRNLQIAAHAGRTAVANMRRQWAVTEFYAREWLKLEPKSAQAQAQLGRALFFREQFQSAYAAFKVAHEESQSMPRAEVNMALLYEELVAQGDRSKRANAKNAMLRAVEMDPEGIATRLAAARWALQTCELEIAEENATAALAINENSIDALMLLGIVARHRKSFEEAEKAFRTVHSRAPTNFEVIRQLALSLLDQQLPAKKQLALDYAELNFRANPNNAQPAGREASVTLAWVLFQMGRASDALATAQSAANAGSLSDESTYFVAKILGAGTQVRLAATLLKPIVEQGRCFPGHEDAKNLLAKLSQK